MTNIFILLVVIGLYQINCLPVEEKQQVNIVKPEEQSSVKLQDEDGAESGAVFLPRSFRRHQRSADMDTAESGAIFIPSFRRGKRSTDLEDMDGAESGAIFIPSFRRGKRSVDLEDMEEAESGAIFLPRSFRRHKRSADLKDMDTAESGAIFIPSFRRGKRSIEDEPEPRTKRGTITVPVYFKKRSIKPKK